MNRDGDQRKTPEQMKAEMERAAREQLHDIANLEKYCLWVAAGGQRRGFSLAEIEEMDPADARDFQLLSRLFAPLYRKYDNERREREKEKAEQEARERGRNKNQWRH